LGCENLQGALAVDAFAQAVDAIAGLDV
jgi:hypothetical protein